MAKKQDIVSASNVEMALYNEDGFVIQRFKQPMIEVKYSPENAIAIARAITDNAFVARDGVKPLGDTLKSELIEQHRIKLTQRFTLMLASLRLNKNKSDGQVALALVEAALKEIF